MGSRPHGLDLVRIPSSFWPGKTLGRNIKPESEKKQPYATRLLPDQKKWLRATNVAHKTTPQDNTENKGVQGGTKNTPKGVTPMVETKIKEGMSKKATRKKVAAETGLKENFVKVAHQRAEKKKEARRLPLSPC